MCKHEHVRFLACTAADRWPGVFVCDDCGEKFSFDPNNPKGVHFLDHANPEHTKVLPPLIASKS